MKNELHEIEVIDSKENWSYYKLADDTVIKFKFVLIRLFAKENGRTLPQDYVFNTSGIIGVISPVNPIGIITPLNPAIINTQEPISQVVDMSFSVQTEAWNEYQLTNGCTLYLKPTLIQVDRTGQRDPAGVPLYKLQTQPIPKIKCANMKDEDVNKWL